MCRRKRSWIMAPPRWGMMTVKKPAMDKGVAVSPLGGSTGMLCGPVQPQDSLTVEHSQQSVPAILLPPLSGCPGKHRLGFGAPFVSLGVRKGDLSEIMRPSSHCSSGFIFFFFPVLGLELRTFIWSHFTSPIFCEGFFEIGSHVTICLGWLQTMILQISAY
jgi:hypothetical protein